MRKLPPPTNRRKTPKDSLMHTVEARIATEHASRYLTQLCRHTSKMGQHPSGDHLARTRHAGDAPPPVLHVECSETFGAICFGEGQCTLQVCDNALLLRVEADTETALRQLQEGIAHRLEVFGHREHLTVRWQSSTYRSIVSVGRFAYLTFVPAVSDDLSDGPGVRRWTLIRTRSTRQCSLCCT